MTNLLFPDQSLESMAIKLIHEFREYAGSDGFYVAYSGGKDSDVILHLMEKAEVMFHAHFNITTVDPDGLIDFIRYERPRVDIEKPSTSMRQLIIDKMSYPLHTRRFCCEHLKERGGEGHHVVTGVRAAESNGRSKRSAVEESGKNGRRANGRSHDELLRSGRRLFERCLAGGGRGKTFLHPIIDWSDHDVWSYIRKEKIKTFNLYEKGFDRVGCVGCPCAGVKKMKQEFNTFPKFRKIYVNAFEGMLKEARRKGKRMPPEWKTGEDVMSSWLKEIKVKRHDDPQRVLFDV